MRSTAKVLMPWLMFTELTKLRRRIHILILNRRFVPDFHWWIGCESCSCNMIQIAIAFLSVSPLLVHVPIPCCFGSHDSACGVAIVIFFSSSLDHLNWIPCLTYVPSGWTVMCHSTRKYSSSPLIFFFFSLFHRLIYLLRRGQLF